MVDILFAEHKHYKYLYDGLVQYIQEHYTLAVDDPHQVPKDLLQYYMDLKSHFVEHPRLLTDYVDDKSLLFDPEDNRYPSESFLISLAEADCEIISQLKDELLDLIDTVWYSFGESNDTEDEDGWHTYYTCGWSGNEDTLSALFNNPYIIAYFEMESQSSVVIKIRKREIATK